MTVPHRDDVAATPRRSPTSGSITPKRQRALGRIEGDIHRLIVPPINVKASPAMTISGAYESFSLSEMKVRSRTPPRVSRNIAINRHK
jgi:hypothetical protein